MRKQVEVSKEVEFVLCPECRWFATYMKNGNYNCPECDIKLTIQRVTVDIMELD
jgi:ssDNA-binding Zn-finger/Zn-ribbon topoisomerase 1